MGEITMSKKHSMKPLAVAIGAALATSVSAGAYAGQNPFGMSSLGQGYMIASPDDGGGNAKGQDGKCGEGKCGAATMKKMGYDGHCGGEMNAKGAEAHCGGAMAADMKGKDGNCGAGKMKDHAMDKGQDGNCGADKKAAMHKNMKGKDGSCGASKGKMKDADDKGTEGKCGGSK